MREEVAIVVPSYNEKNNIESLIKKIIKNIPEGLIYIVDDSSPDKTKDLVKKLMKKNKRLNLIIRKTKSGRGGAVLEGFKAAFKNPKIKYFIEMDADLSHSPDEINNLLSYASTDTVVVGSRYVKGSKILNWPLHRRVLSKFANLYIKVLLGIKINDFTNGFRCYPRNAVKILQESTINHKGFIALSEMAYILFLKKIRFQEVPITFEDRESGNSNATMAEVIKSLIAVVEIKGRYR